MTLCADFIVRRRGRLFAADSKTGRAARATDAATRRQLLEYMLAFAVDGVLLVDPEAGRVVEVVFKQRPTRVRLLVLFLAVLGAVFAALRWG